MMPPQLLASSGNLDPFQGRLVPIESHKLNSSTPQL